MSASPAGHARPRRVARTYDDTGATVRCDGCGLPAGEGDHARCARRRGTTDPPRYCTRCGRKLAVQVLPIGWRAHCVRCGAPAEPGA